jgi:hypothetical protein
VKTLFISSVPTFISACAVAAKPNVREAKMAVESRDLIMDVLVGWFV